MHQEIPEVKNSRRAGVSGAATAAGRRGHGASRCHWRRRTTKLLVIATDADRLREHYKEIGDAQNHSLARVRRDRSRRISICRSSRAKSRRRQSRRRAGKPASCSHRRGPPIPPDYAHRRLAKPATPLAASPTSRPGPRAVPAATARPRPTAPAMRYSDDRVDAAQPA